MEVVNDFLNVSTVARRFRFVAIAEAVSWLGLLISMGFKYIPAHGNPIGVHVFGMIHGLIFIAFVVMSFVAARALKWTPLVTFAALLSSLPPFCTVVFEMWAARTGRLGELSGRTEELAAAQA